MATKQFKKLTPAAIRRLSKEDRGAYRKAELEDKISKMTPAQKEAYDKREAAKVEKRKAEAAARKAKREKYASIPDDVKKMLMQDILDFDERGICRDGRIRFLKSIGFPTPPKSITISIPVRVAVTDADIRSDYGTSVAKVDAVKKKFNEIKEALPEGFEITLSASDIPTYARVTI